MRWANSAFKHGIARERSGYLVETYPPAEVVPLANDPAVEGLLYLGDDPQGVAPEVIAIPIRVGDGVEDHLVIHAMRLRRQYRGRYGEIMREHWRVG